MGKKSQANSDWYNRIELKEAAPSVDLTGILDRLRERRKGLTTQKPCTTVEDKKLIHEKGGK